MDKFKDGDVVEILVETSDPVTTAIVLFTDTLGCVYVCKTDRDTNGGKNIEMFGESQLELVTK